MSYQKCPICNGEGMIHEPYSTGTKTKCPVCNGEKIIDELTGLPPKKDNHVVVNIDSNGTKHVIKRKQ